MGVKKTPFMYAPKVTVIKIPSIRTPVIKFPDFIFAPIMSLPDLDF